MAKVGEVSVEKLFDAAATLGYEAYETWPVGMCITFDRISLDVVLHEDAGLLEFRAEWPGRVRDAGKVAEVLRQRIWRGLVFREDSGAKRLEVSLMTDVRMGLSAEQLKGWLVFVHNDLCVLFHDLGTQCGMHQTAPQPLKREVAVTLPAVIPERLYALLAHDGGKLQVTDTTYYHELEVGDRRYGTISLDGEELQLEFRDEGGLFSSTYLPQDVGEKIDELNRKTHVGVVEEYWGEISARTVFYCGAGASDEQLESWCAETMPKLEELVEHGACKHNS
ncbi:hypothetical protein CMUST_06840 [Corynebacterium mustelae]|uniref:Bacterial sensory transduction regulator n=1 Tax=Corynebacterium mustelae TaxID=571915 RepID=A0A0G3H3P1_9CORY|nr:hypothetical protein [Corynebacterium mustelae]AKK05702.1 hypothetical protein CMUST_06840 [Corynebacterium mustelae]